MSPDTNRNKIGAGKSIVNRHERSFSRGSLMFIEGEKSTEMFIIRSGLVRILKQEGENTVELAQLGPGSVLGELSLLDHQPRGATAQVLEDTTVTIIDEELFTRTLNNIPNWLENIIKLVVKRLRDTMKKTGDDIVTKSIGSVIQVMHYMMQVKVNAGNSGVTDNELLVEDIRKQVFAIIGLGSVELENIFLHLILKKLLLLKKNSYGQEYAVFTDPDMLQLYVQYLRIHQRGGTLIGEEFNELTFDTIDVLLEAGGKFGTGVSGKLLSVNKQQLEITLSRQGKERFLDLDACDQLIDAKLLTSGETNTESKFGHHSRATYIFNPQLLKNVVALREWLPVFREEVKF